MITETPRSVRVLPVLAALLVGGLAIVAAQYLRPYPIEADSGMLDSSRGIIVERSSLGLSFMPEASIPEIGLVFYVGAKVPPEAYAYIGRSLADEGYAAFIASFPLQFALFDPWRVEKVAALFPVVKRWVVGGHSLGGAMASIWAGSRFSEDKQKESASGLSLSGLFLLASYPGMRTDLSASGLPTLSIAASADGLATPEKLEKARRLLPPGTRYITIAGGNHAQFGQYGPQPGDGAAELPGEAQRKFVVAETLSFFRALVRDGR